MKTAASRSRIHPHRTGIVVVGLLILGIGFAFFVSSAYLAESDSYHPAPLTQLRWIGLSILAFGIVLLPSYRKIGRRALLIYGVCIALLVMTALFGQTRNSSKRWLHIVGSIGIQPSEFMKIGLLLAMARLLRHHEPGYGWRKLLAPMVITLVPIGLVIQQPDLGMCLLYLPIVGAMVWASGVRARIVGVVAVVVLVAAPLAYFFGLKDYQRARIQTFVAWDVEKHGKYDLYQPLNARIAVADGGVSGRGLFRGPQNIGGYLPAKCNDYIFAVIAEEGGLLMCVTLLLLYYLLVGLILHAAMEFREPYGRLILVGVGGLLGTQVLVNTAVASGLLPTTGLTLPLVSAGGSSMLTTCVLLGLVVNVLGRRDVSMARPSR